MRLTRQSSYAIRTLIYCAVNGERLSRVADIAKAHAISELFLFKLIRPLVDGGLLETVRGRRGGIRLARPATEISLLDTVKLTEENFAMAECFEGGSDVHCPLAGACDLIAVKDTVTGTRARRASSSPLIPCGITTSLNNRSIGLSLCSSASAAGPSSAVRTR